MRVKKGANVRKVFLYCQARIGVCLPWERWCIGVWWFWMLVLESGCWQWGRTDTVGRVQGDGIDVYWREIGLNV